MAGKPARQVRRGTWLLSSPSDFVPLDPTHRIAAMTERVVSEGFYEMLWDCDHCDTKGLLAKSQRHCANCGAPQSAYKRYFPTVDGDNNISPGAPRTLRLTISANF